MSKAHGTHIFLDYTGFFPEIENLGEKILSLMEKIIDNSAANRVHSHVEIFDGTTSPPGFAPVHDIPATCPELISGARVLPNLAVLIAPAKVMNSLPPDCKNSVSDSADFLTSPALKCKR